MGIFIVTTYIIQSMAVSLGVGSSTLAITNFFVAIADGTISPDERKMMGVVYIILRVAMVLILVTALILSGINLSLNGAEAINAYSIAQWTLIIMLFLNSLLMTLKVMSSKVGPALQASTWYSLGFIASLSALDMATFTIWQFFIGYIAFIILAVALVNGLMSRQKKKRESAAV